LKHIVYIQKKRIEIELPEDAAGMALIDGRAAAIDWREFPNGKGGSLLLNGKSFTIELEREGGEYRIQTAGHDLKATVTDERQEALLKLIGAAARPKTAAGELHAPMPGLIVRIHPAAGEAVKSGAGVMVIEAMKMENELKAPIDGVVESIRVNAGQVVEKGQLLMVIKK
jgi:biotin carboxyl carrier protein